MSDAVSALQGAVAQGYATITDQGPRGMITLRGDLSAKELQDAVTGLSGTGFPGQGEAKIDGGRGVCWMSPDELLILVPYADASDAAARLQEALHGSHHLAANVSDARAVFAVTGAHAREVLAKLTPADLAPDALGPGRIRRTRLAQVPAALWMTNETDFEVICFRSVAQYVFDILKSAATPGSDVDYF